MEELKIVRLNLFFLTDYCCDFLKVYCITPVESIGSFSFATEVSSFCRSFSLSTHLLCIFIFMQRQTNIRLVYFSLKKGCGYLGSFKAVSLLYLLRKVKHGNCKLRTLLARHNSVRNKRVPRQAAVRCSFEQRVLIVSDSVVRVLRGIEYHKAPSLKVKVRDREEVVLVIFSETIMPKLIDS